MSKYFSFLLFRYSLLLLGVGLFLQFLFTACSSGDKASTVNDTIKPDFPELTEALKKDPQNADLYRERAKLYLEAGKLTEALNDINRALGINSEKAVYYLTRSDIYFASGKAQPARQDLSTAIAKEPENTEALMKIAELHLYFREYQECTDYIKKTLAIDPDYPQAYFMMGFVYKEKGDTNKAIRQFQITTEKDRKHYHAFLQLGLLHASRKNPLAIDYYRNALDIKPTSTEALYNLAMFYQENKMYNQAIEAYTNIIKLDNKYKFAYFNLGYIHLEMLGVNSAAADYFSKAIQVDPYYAEAYYNKGVALERMGDVVNARYNFQKALEYKHNYDLAIEGLNRLDMNENSN